MYVVISCNVISIYICLSGLKASRARTLSPYYYISLWLASLIATKTSALVIHLASLAVEGWIASHLAITQVYFLVHWRDFSRPERAECGGRTDFVRRSVDCSLSVRLLQRRKSTQKRTVFAMLSSLSGPVKIVRVCVCFAQISQASCSTVCLFGYLSLKHPLRWTFCFQYKICWNLLKRQSSS